MPLSRSRFLSLFAALSAAGASASPAVAAVPPWYPLPPPIKPNQRALVLSGGGARGAYEAGVLARLYENVEADGLPYDIVCGTSAGAINAAFAARSTRESIDEARKFWLEIPDAHIVDLIDPVQHAMLAAEAFRESTQHGYPRKLKYLARANSELGAMGPLSDLKDTLGVVSEQPIQDLVRKYPMSLDELRATLVITATNVTVLGSDAFYRFVGPSAIEDEARFVDLGQKFKIAEEQILRGVHARRVPLREETFIPAVIASTAIPGAFAPVSISDTAGNVSVYVDGGVANNTPVGLATDAGATDITVVFVNAPEEFEPPQPTNMLELVANCYNLMHQKIVEADLELVLAQNLLSKYGEYKGLSPLAQRYLDTLGKEGWHPLTLRLIYPRAALPVDVMGFNDPAGLQKAFDAGFADANEPMVYTT
jgi:predicted acylesterase/phospholipase RssA